MSEYTEEFEAPEITDEGIQDFIDNGGEVPTFHPVLRVWKEVLSNAPGELNASVTPQWANRITSSYREINFADMEDFRDTLFGKVIRFGEILDAEIDTDEDCLTYTTPEEDVEHNSEHYRNVLRDWQLELLSWELDWECTYPKAAIELAAISEVHKMFFGSTGLTQFLDNIKFEFTEHDQAELAQALNDLKEGR